MSSNRPPVDGAELHGPAHLTEHDVVRRRRAKEAAARQREAPTVPRRAWRDPQIAKAAWLSGAGFTNAEIARMLGSTEQRIGAMLRRIGLRSRNTDGNRLLSQMVPQHTFAFIAAAARDAGLGVGPYVVAAALGQALHGQSDVLAAVRHVVPGAEPPEVAVDPGPLLGDGSLPPDQAAAVDASIRRLYSRPLPPGPKRRSAGGSK
jgi:hypothetical protein